MKNLLIISTLMFVALISKAQNTEPCYFDKYQRNNKKTIENAELEIQRELFNAEKKLLSHNPNLKIIPVVVHVIHDGGTNNISDAQIQSQIDVLNEDFRKKVGTNGFGAGVDTDIEFCLAKKDPLGKCTNGIVRINSPLSNHQTYQRSQLKLLSYWDNTRYLNMYVVKNINNGSGILGYSSFPGGPPDEDGIVVKHNYYGRIGTAASSLGRTTTHEIGHWFGLYHTFNGGCGVDTCADGDLVCDTPPAANPNYGCPTINSCSNDFPNIDDQIQNYMDYSNDNCKSMFSNGQKQRMHATLTSFRNDIWQQWNLDSTGCDSGFVNSNCKVIADFVTLNQNICIGNSIVFYNKSQNNPTTYQWYFQGGTPAISSVANPTVSYAAIGNFQVKLIATNSYGTDSLISNNYVNVTTPPVGQALPYFENFESVIFPTNGITIDNPDGGITWQRDTIAVAYQGLASAKIDNLININYGQSDALLLPRFDFTSFVGTPYLNFKWAYAKSDPNYSDELIVLVSKDCGVNWSQVFYRTGTAMTTGTTQTTPYLPSASTVWKIANISLATYTTYPNVQIKIVNVTDGGNNLYVDNINLGALITSINETETTVNDVLIYPNPTSGSFSIEYQLTKNEDVTIEMTDVLGREVYKTMHKSQTVGLNKQEVNTLLKSGVYNITIKTGNSTINKKVIINK
ncbi:MAG: T9SS type A sorting domain-containing protein [Bacteroidia bacterium]|jgi:PKD repeat protein|nr:T9SS type A sorting domain-containing protein [Bacteroidia bacterium]